MYVKKLQLSNFQIIEDLDAEFEGGIYFITGENELGKSTLLKALSVLLTGNRDEVLKKGASKGFAKTIIGDDNEDYEVELRMTEKNPRGTLTIKSKKTGMSSDKVSMLQQIFGYQDFDAVEFSQWSETTEGRRKQSEIVKSLLPGKIQKRIAEIDTEYKDTYDKRADANRDLKQAVAMVESLEKDIAPGDVKKYAAPIDIKDLLAEQQTNAQLIEKAKTIKSAKAEREKQLEEIPNRVKLASDEYTAEVDRLNQLLADAEKKHNETLNLIETEKKDFENRKANAEAWLENYEKNNPEKSNAATKLQESEEHNKKHAKVVQYKERQKAKDAADKVLSDYETKLERLKSERKKLISESKIPISGLNFTDDGLELNGVPFVPGKVSDSQIMEVAAKLIILKNPTVKVFRIARGESLGKARLKAIIDLAKKEGYQGFLEQVVREQQELRIEEYTEK